MPAIMATDRVAPPLQLGRAFLAVCRRGPGWCGTFWGKLSIEALEQRVSHEETCQGA
jgi:hypothetical protein